MKTWYLFSAMCFLSIVGLAQAPDTTKTSKPDTIVVGKMIIIKTRDKVYSNDSSKIKITWNTSSKPKRLTTNWLSLDLGFSNFNDQTNYASADARDYARVQSATEPAFTSSDFNVRNGRSFNINVWIFRQYWGITRDLKLNLSYGLMIETNNFRYENNISHIKGNRPYVQRDNISFSKNKLATSYLTLPVMLGYSSKPGKSNSFHIAGGVSMGYLYSSRNKQISESRGKEKIKGDFDLESFKFQYVGEVGVGPVKLYTSIAPKSMYQRGLDMRPFNIGIRLGGWD
ncbi:MAG: hypothetical protein EAY75_09390 [Bacteroidetes bacterium]|nr:MAG: hypothetical protein EAY75_09390 [Bacteroidota bacterium]